MCRYKRLYRNIIGYCPHLMKQSAALTAFNHLSAEYRRYLAMIEKREKANQTHEEIKQDAHQKRHDSRVSPEDKSVLIKTPVPRMKEALKYIDSAASSVEYARDYSNEKNPDSHTKESMERCKTNATESYKKAFEIVPELKDKFQNDPKHEPKLFPS